ncbi:MAG: DUF1295 domain-containing protein [Bdellovibrionota bacterium]
MENTFWNLLLIGLATVCVIMAVSWVAAKKVDNYSLVDAVWAFCFMVLTGLFAYLGTGWETRRTVIFIMVGLWSFRLGYFLARRIESHHPKEDSRYLKLREDYGKNVAMRFFLFFQMQAVSVSILTVIFLEIVMNPEPQLHPLEIIGTIVWGLSLLGEAIADGQMSRFKSKPENKGKNCEVGLWKYSRHPNYFFESCIWWGYFIFALGTPGTVYTIYCPLIILFLLLKVTGVPPAEAQSIKSRGQKYRDYQRRTSVFIPWFPKA